MRELKRCPFCGGEANGEYLIKDDDHIWEVYWVKCGNASCAVDGPTKSIPDEAVSAWNTRRNEAADKE